MDDPNQQLGSAVADIARQKAIRAAEDAGRPAPSEAELDAIGKRADALNVFGFDAKQDRNGNWIQQGVGAPGRESANHFQSILRYEGRESYERAVRKMYRENPQRAKALNLPEPTRAGA